MTQHATTTPRDLGDDVTAFLLDGEAEPQYWSTFRHALDGTVAVTVDTVPIGGRKVQMQMLGNLAASLRRSGFELTVETVWPEQTEPVDGGALYLHITEYAATVARPPQQPAANPAAGLDIAPESVPGETR